MGKLVTLQTQQGNLEAYEVGPEAGCRGALIIIHEVWGLTDHIKSIAERFAKEGYLALAPDLLSGAIDVAAISGMQNELFNPEKRNSVQPKLRALMAPIQNPKYAQRTLAALADCFEYLYKLPDKDQNIAVAGFCFGGTYSFGLAVKEPRLKLALPFYGHADYSAEELDAINCPVRAFYGEKDENLMAGLPELKKKMRQASVDFEAIVYPNCGHAFFNDTNPFAYNPAAASDAWQKTMGYLKAYM